MQETAFFAAKSLDVGARYQLLALIIRGGCKAACRPWGVDLRDGHSVAVLLRVYAKCIAKGKR